MYCSKCGTAIPQGAAFCPSCGTSQSPPLASTTPSTPFSARSVPPIARPYASASLAPLFPRPAYAGFWLRVVAHLIDALLAAIAFCAVFLTGIAAIGIGYLRNLIHQTNNPEDVYSGTHRYNCPVQQRRNRDDVDLLRMDGELFLSGNAW